MQNTKKLALSHGNSRYKSGSVNPTLVLYGIGYNSIRKYETQGAKKEVDIWHKHKVIIACG